MSSVAPTRDNIIRFDDITVDAGNFCALKNGQNIKLTPRAFAVLPFLIERGTRVVEKQEIFEAIWKETFVSDNALTKVIKEIRHAIGDSAENPRYIETVPKHGYRFIGHISADTDETRIEPGQVGNGEIHIERPGRFVSPSTVVVLLLMGLIAMSIGAWVLFRQAPAEIGSSPVRSIAVLPFKPLDADSRNESLEMGMAESLITRLSNLKNLAVRPMGSVRKYTDLQQDPIIAGKETGVEAILDGTIQKSGERIRVTVRLIDVSGDKPLWSAQFDENFTDIFKVQDSIAERVTNALALRLSGQEKEQLAKHYTDNAEAYQLYLKAQLVWHGRRQNWIEQSLELYKQAAEKDPNFALAYIGIADCYIMLNGHKKIHADETVANARPAIIRALEIDETLAQAHNALAELRYQYEYDWAGADTEFKRAIELNPNVAWIRQAYGWYLMSLGRFDEANAEMDKAHELDPSSLTVNAGRGRLYYYSWQYDRAIQHFTNLIAVEPNDESLQFALFTTYEQAGMYPEAVDLFLKRMTANGVSVQKIEEFRAAFEADGWLGFLRKRLEQTEKGANVRAIGLANLYVRLGEKENALFWLEKAFEARDPAVIQLKIEPAYDSLRDDPRFAELIRKIGLQP